MPEASPHLPRPTALPSTTAADSPRTTLTETLISLERSLHDPATRADSEAVSRLLSPDFFEFGASGRVWSREAILAHLATENPSEITSRDYTCQPLSPDITLLTYLSETPQRRVLRSSLWRLEGETWRLVFHQSTPILNMQSPREG